MEYLFPIFFLFTLYLKMVLKPKERKQNEVGKEEVIHIDLEDSVATKPLTRRESFPEEILAACFALSRRHHGTGGALHLQARALALHAARHLL